MLELSGVKERRSPFQLSDNFFSFKTLSKHLNTAHSFLSIMANSSLEQRVEFQELSKLPPPLAAHPTFQFLHDRVSAIDAEILGAKSRKRKLKIVTQTAAVHLTCLRVAKAIALTEENRDPQCKKAWTKALVKIVDRAQDVNATFHAI